MLEAAGPGQGDDDEQQPCGRDDFTEQDRRAATVMLRRAASVNSSRTALAKGELGDDCWKIE